MTYVDDPFGGFDEAVPGQPELIANGEADWDIDDDPRVVTNPDGSASFAPGVKLVGMGF